MKTTRRNENDGKTTTKTTTATTATKNVLQPEDLFFTSGDRDGDRIRACFNISETKRYRRMRESDVLLSDEDIRRSRYGNNDGEK